MHLSAFINIVFISIRHLQCGDISTAEKKFSAIPPNNPSSDLKSLVNKGLLAVAQNDYNEAYNLFQKAHEMDKNNVMVRIFL